MQATQYAVTLPPLRECRRLALTPEGREELVAMIGPALDELRRDLDSLPSIEEGMTEAEIEECHGRMSHVDRRLEYVGRRRDLLYTREELFARRLAEARHYEEDADMPTYWREPDGYICAISDETVAGIAPGMAERGFTWHRLDGDAMPDEWWPAGWLTPRQAAMAGAAA